ncbi:MAG TPA: hypothetical protein VNK95_10755, partial [Caldilineaceae bacterium]|nr:hypothetical protein [Caldilineaceae bacterium]
MPKRRWWFSSRKRPAGPTPPGDERFTADSTFEWEFEQEAAGASPLPPALYRRSPAPRGAAGPAGAPPVGRDGAPAGGAGQQREPVNEAHTVNPSPLA